MGRLIEILERQADAQPDRLGWVVGEDRWTYGQLAAAVDSFAGGLRDLGLQPGTRVSLMVPNCSEFLVAYFGVMRAGLVVNPLNTAFTPREITYLVGDCEAEALVIAGDLRETLSDTVDGLGLDHVVSTAPAPASGDIPFEQVAAADARPLPLPDEDAMAYIPYSSGTTGRAKGIVHSHATLTAQAALSAEHLQMRPDDVGAHGLPLFHAFGGNIVLGGLIVAGGTLVVQPSFDAPGMVCLLDQHDVTALAGVPTMFTLLSMERDEPTEPPRTPLERCWCAGAPLPDQVQRAVLHRFGAPVLNCYGITEAGGNLIASVPGRAHPELSCGVPYPQTEVRIVDPDDRELPVGEVGEVVARGPQVMTGYWNRPDDTARALRGGWFHTGDMGRRDEEGNYFIVDRKNDMIITGGYNVYPAEIENVLHDHPGVAMCVAFGVAHPVKGEQPWAAIVPADGAELNTADLDAFCRERLAPYKVPRAFRFVDELPRSSVGKILRREVRARFGGHETPAASPSSPYPSTA